MLVAYDNYAKNFVCTKPKPLQSKHNSEAPLHHRGEVRITERTNLFNIVWFDKSDVYACNYNRQADTKPSVVIYPKPSRQKNYTHSWIIWVNDIALSMNINTNYVNTEDESSYMATLQQFSTKNQTIIGIIEVNADMIYPFNYKSTCEYIIPIIPIVTRVMYIGKINKDSTILYCVLD